MDEDDQNLSPTESGDESGFGQDTNADFADKYPLVARQQARNQQNNNRRESAREKAGEAKDKAKDFVAQKTRQAAMQAIRSAATAAWASIAAVLGPYAGIIVVCLLVILLITVPAIAIWSKAHAGTLGNGPPDYLSVSGSSGKSELSMNELRDLFGQGLIVDQNPERFYFCQADPVFNNKDLEGYWHAGKRLKNAGCTLTSITMIMRFYGINNVSPVDVANYHASGVAGGYLGLRGNHTDLFNHFAGPAGVPERNAKNLGDIGIQEIKKLISSKTPILAGGTKVCGSSGQHWIVIIGVSRDERSVIISDPAGGWRSSPARHCSLSDLNTEKHIIYQEK